MQKPKTNKPKEKDRKREVVLHSDTFDET